MAKTPKAIADMSTLSRVIFDPDVTPPTTPTNVLGTPISSSRIDLSWSASTDTGGSGLAGYLVYRNGVFIAPASATAYSDTGLTASTSYQYQVGAVDAAGNASTLSGLITVTTQANVGPPAFAPTQPTAAFVGIAGVRTYTDPTQQAAIGRYTWFVLGASWEAWANSGRDLDTIVKAIKAASTAPSPTLLFNYINLAAIEEDANDPRPTWTAEVAARNWRLYVTGAAGALAGSSGTISLVDYTDFVPVNPSLEHPYEFGAKYSYFMFLSKTKSDARFSGLSPGLASSSLDGVYQDNFLLDPRVNADWNRDAITEGQGLPSTVTPWLAAGQARYVATMRTLAPTKYVFANAGDYGVTSAGLMAGKLDGLLAESYMGKNWSWETSLPYTTVLQYYYNALAAAVNPHMVVFGGTYPDTNPDGSALTRLPTANGFPPQNTQWQWARYIAATAYLGEGMPGINRFSQGYSSDLAALDWYDFFGGVNGLARAWLGAPVDALRPTTPKVAKGSIGLFGVEYQNGIVLVNPKGNGTQTVVNADIPGNWKFLPGTQDPTRDSGAAFSSVSLPERDGLFLARVAGFVPQSGYTYSATTISDGHTFTITRSAGGFGTKPVDARPLLFIDPAATGNLNPSPLCRTTATLDNNNLTYQSTGGPSGTGWAQGAAVVSGDTGNMKKWTLAVDVDQWGTSNPSPALNGPGAKYYLWRTMIRNFGHYDENYDNYNIKGWRLWGRTPDVVGGGSLAYPDIYMSYSNQRLTTENASSAPGTDFTRAGQPAGSTDAVALANVIAFDGGVPGTPDPVTFNRWFSEEIVYRANQNDPGTSPPKPDNTSVVFNWFVEGKLSNTAAFQTPVFTYQWNQWYTWAAGIGRMMRYYFWHYIVDGTGSTSQGPRKMLPVGSYVGYGATVVDDSWCRIHIRDNATRASFTMTEYQPPSAWTDTSVTFTLRKGRFASYSGKSLIITDNSGVEHYAGDFV